MTRDQLLINEIIKGCQFHGVSEDELLIALMSMMYTAMKAGAAEEHQLANGDGECLINVKRYK